MKSTETEALSDENLLLPEPHRVTVSIRPDETLIDSTAFIAPGSIVLGNVRIGAEASIWFGAVMRGDAERIEVGARTNVQDQCVLHADPGLPCVLGNDVTVGHSAVVHGAVVEDEALIGIGAIILNGAKIGRGAIIGAGALVTEGTEIPAGMLALGSPAKVVKPVPQSLATRCRENAKHYVRLAAAYKAKYDSAKYVATKNT